MKWIGAVLIASLATLALWINPGASPEPGDAPAFEEPQFAVCSVDEGSGRSTEAVVLSGAEGPVQLTLFAGGGPAGSLGTSVAASGSAVFPVVDISAVGNVGAIVDLPAANSAVGVTINGSATFVADTCGADTPAISFIGGGTTIREQVFVLQLMNPFAGEAIVRLKVTTENGLESADFFDSVTVPARDSRVVDFSELIPGRETISVRIETLKGRAIGVGRQLTDGDSALWAAVEPALDWFVPIPVGEGAKEVRIGNASDAEIEYQVDLYGPNGFEDAFVTASIPAGGVDVFDVGAVGPDTMALRVIATDPVVPTLIMSSDLGLGVTVGSPAAWNRWLLPGAGTPPGGWATMTIFNPSLEDATVVIQPIGGRARTVQVAADDLIELALQSTTGYIVEADVQVVVGWAAYRTGAFALVSGVPIVDG